MPEHLADKLLTLGSVVRWLEKYNESNALILLSRLCRAHDLRDLDQLEVFVEREERMTSELPGTSDSPKDSKGSEG